MVNNEKEICHNLLLKDQKKKTKKGCHLKKRNFDVKIRGKKKNRKNHTKSARQYISMNAETE